MQPAPKLPLHIKEREPSLIQSVLLSIGTVLINVLALILISASMSEAAIPNEILSNSKFCARILRTNPPAGDCGGDSGTGGGGGGDLSPPPTFSLSETRSKGRSEI